MRKYQREVIKSRLTDEKFFLKDLTKTYKDASKQISKNISVLLARNDSDLQHVIYQIQYQKALKEQIDSVLDNLRKSDYDSISNYVKQSYEEGFAGSMYNLQKQGIPLAFPINQDQVIKAIKLDSKIKDGMYKRLGVNSKNLKDAIRSEISRGISTGASYADIAKSIDRKVGSGLYNSMRIARTEGHRVAEEAKMDAMLKCKKLGANVVKKWDSTLDGKTRPSHRALDGQVRELDEPFSNGLQFPSDPNGIAKEVINCRCTMLEIGKWELDEDDVNTKFLNDDEGKIISFEDSESYEDFKKQYWSKIPKTTTTTKRKKKSEEIVLEGNMYPKILAGAKRGKPMDFIKANERRTNPNYDKDEGYQVNCQSCVVGYEARRRGYNVETLPNTDGSMLDRLSSNTRMAWIDPTTGKYPEYIYSADANTPKKFQKYLESVIESDKRYTLQFRWKGRRRDGHIIHVDRLDDGALRLYDPQVGDQIIGDIPILQYINRFKFSITIYGTKYSSPPRILRVDNMEFNVNVVNEILKEST